MKQLFIIFCAVFVYACTHGETSESKLKKMFIVATNNNSTSPNFVVIHAIELKSNEQKDLCIDYMAFGYALYLDSQKLNIEKVNYAKNGIPIFKFQTEKAIEYLYFHDYNVAIVDSIIHNTNNLLMSEILNQNKNDGYSKLLEINSLKYNRKYFEHFLYMNGIPTYRDCESGYTVIVRGK